MSPEPVHPADAEGICLLLVACNCIFYLPDFKFACNLQLLRLVSQTAAIGLTIKCKEQHG
jgi:hypothetical protein